MRSTVTSKGQTTVPKLIREQLHLDRGSEIDWTLQPDGTVLLRPAAAPYNPFVASLGAFPLPEGMSTAEFMQDLRGEGEATDRVGPGAKVISLDDFLRAARQ
jgi:AbrB family looped-hinge helix DNA binding protein